MLGRHHMKSDETTTINVNLNIIGLVDPRIGQVLEMLGRIIANQVAEGTLMSQMDDEIVDLQTKVAANGSVIDSAVIALNGIGAMIQTAVDAALAAGATPAQLQAVTDVSNAVQAKSTELAAAIPQGTPSA